MLHLILLILSFTVWAQGDHIHSVGYLGEKDIRLYTDRYQPLIFQDIYQGKLTFQDEEFSKNFFNPYLFENQETYAQFLQSEVRGALYCPNEVLTKHFDDIRFSYRLITLSYLLEGLWHNELISRHFRFKKGCQFDLKTWAKTCRPKSQEMKTFVHRIGQYLPKYDESIPPDYKKHQWWREFRDKDYKWYSHYRLGNGCKGNCSEEDLEENFNKTCQEDIGLMTAICSENDEIYGLSKNRDAYSLLGQSNIINTYNKNGEGLGCLRRFSELMSHKEVQYEVLNQLFPSLQNFLRDRYKQRFLQGRVFFFGSGKEFEMKGLKDLYVKDQTLAIGPIRLEQDTPTVPTPITASANKDKTPIALNKKEKKAPEVFREVPKILKSAFLQAAEIRSEQGLEIIEVDMLKLKYDHVFSLHMLNSLSQKLPNFMTREALLEMHKYDKLGAKEGPVPLIFIKYMIDMQVHQGLWNVISILGDKFYVSNEIDESFSPQAELIHLRNDSSTGNQWQIYILKP